MSVVESVAGELQAMPEKVAEGALAAVALNVAEALDDPGTRASARAMLAKELRETMSALRALAPVKREHDGIDDLRSRRARRRSVA